MKKPTAATEATVGAYLSKARERAKAPPVGGEHPAQTPKDNAILAKGDAGGDALPPDLAAVVAAWPHLPDASKRSILATVREASAAAKL